MFGLSLSRSRYSRCIRSSILFLISLKSACIVGQTVILSQVRANKGLRKHHAASFAAHTTAIGIVQQGLV